MPVSKRNLKKRPLLVGGITTHWYIGRVYLQQNDGEVHTMNNLNGTIPFLEHPAGKFPETELQVMVSTLKGPLTLTARVKADGDFKATSETEINGPAGETYKMVGYDMDHRHIDNRMVLSKR